MADLDYPCPNCGATDAWEADYYEAVHQSISLYVSESGEPEFGDYTGAYEAWDDGSTEDERWFCRECEYEIRHGSFRFVPDGGYVLTIHSEQELAALRTALKRRIISEQKTHWQNPEIAARSNAPFRELLKRAEELGKEKSCS